MSNTLSSLNNYTFSGNLLSILLALILLLYIIMLILKIFSYMLKPFKFIFNKTLFLVNVLKEWIRLNKVDSTKNKLNIENKIYNTNFANNQYDINTPIYSDNIIDFQNKRKKKDNKNND